MVICLEQGADLHIAQLMPLPLTVSCFNKIQNGFTFLALLTPGSPGKGPLNGCVCVMILSMIISINNDRSNCIKLLITVVIVYVHRNMIRVILANPSQYE